MTQPAMKATPMEMQALTMRVRSSIKCSASVISSKTSSEPSSGRIQSGRLGLRSRGILGTRGDGNFARRDIQLPDSPARMRGRA